MCSPHEIERTLVLHQLTEEPHHTSVDRKTEGRARPIAIRHPTRRLDAVVDHADEITQTFVPKPTRHSLADSHDPRRVAPKTASKPPAAMTRWQDLVNVPHNRATTCARHGRTPKMRQAIHVDDVGIEVCKELPELPRPRIWEQKSRAACRLEPQGLALGLHQPAASDRNHLHLDVVTGLGCGQTPRTRSNDSDSMAPATQPTGQEIEDPLSARRRRIRGEVGQVDDLHREAISRRPRSMTGHSFKGRA
jgi:hypothetical protein